MKKEPPFAGLHVCPGSSLDVTDDKAVRLVVLKTTDSYRMNAEICGAIEAAEDILNNRGSSPRIYKNMLAFIAPDKDVLLSLQQAVREYLAWNSIKNDREDLNLDAAQDRETENSLVRSNETVESRIREAYCWLLVPYIDRFVDMKTITWEAVRISGGTESIVSKAAMKMQQNEQLITKWAPALLLMELDSVLWNDNDSIPIKLLWDHLCKYCYLPRLASYHVLEETISSGINSTEYFALCEAVSGDRFVDLKYNQYVGFINESACLVKIIAALKQITAERTEEGTGQRLGRDQPTDFSGTGSAAAEPDNPQDEVFGLGDSTENRFYMSAALDTTRIGRDVQKLVEEVISHLTSLDDCEVSITLEVAAKNSEGFTIPTIRVVSENCRTLKVKDFGFEYDA